MLEHVIHIATVILHVIVFGYVELKWSLGWVISCLLTLYLLVKRKSIIPPILCALEYSIANSGQKKVSYVCFLLLEWLYFTCTRGNETEVSVDFQPREQEIRKYLMAKDPSKLHKVDDWMVKYKGKEDELLRRLKSKYEITHHSDPRPTQDLPRVVTGWGSIHTNRDSQQREDDFSEEEDDDEQDCDEQVTQDLNRDKVVYYKRDDPIVLEAKRRAREGVLNRIRARKGYK